MQSGDNLQKTKRLLSFDNVKKDIGESKVTSVALHTSFSVLQRPTPSIMALAISSMYFSSERDSISLRIESLFSLPIDRRIRLMSVVCLFKDESRFLGTSIKRKKHLHDVQQNHKKSHRFHGRRGAYLELVYSEL